MDEQTVNELHTQAADIASKNPPLRVLDTAVLGLLVGIGWLIGRAWWLLVYSVVFASKGCVAYVLAIRHGYRKGTKKDFLVAAAQHVQQQTEATLLDDDRIADYHTPFGVPFGPNVQAYSEPA